MVDWTSLRDLARKEVRDADQVHITQAVARVDPSGCTGCKLCAVIGHCYAITMVEAKDGLKHNNNKNNLVAIVDPVQLHGLPHLFRPMPNELFRMGGRAGGPETLTCVTEAGRATSMPWIIRNLAEHWPSDQTASGKEATDADLNRHAPSRWCGSGPTD